MEVYGSWVHNSASPRRLSVFEEAEVMLVFLYESKQVRLRLHRQHCMKGLADVSCMRSPSYCNSLPMQKGFSNVNGILEIDELDKLIAWTEP